MHNNTKMLRYETITNIFLLFCAHEVGLWVYLAAVLWFLPRYLPLPGASVGCDRKHRAVIKPLPLAGGLT